MKTQCPQCETQFRVTEAQISLADGYVRCGVCEHVFNIFEIGTAPSPEVQHQAASDNDSDSETGTVLKQEIIIENETAATKIQDDSLDFFNEEVASSLPHVVPEKFRRTNSTDKSSAMATVLWSIGTLLLTACLFLEYIWFNRDLYYQSAGLQAAIQSICQQFHCSGLSLRNPAKIELTARNIYTHPNEKNALMIDVTMKNIANHAQPYPVMNISFSDLRGKIVASRNFLPEEYMAIENKQISSTKRALLAPDTSTSLTLEIQDPGKQATTYEFNFL